jgi:hypothetical protein
MLNFIADKKKSEGGTTSNCMHRGTNQRNQQVLTENIFNIQHLTLGKIQYSFTYNNK